jgi:glycosyltransferase involved in cell wall biosynthesis
MKIAIVETDSKGGLIHYAYQLAEAFAELGVDTTLVTGRDYELAALPHRCKVAPILNLWSPIEAPPRSALAAWLRRRLWPLRRAWRAFVLAREWGRLTRYLRRMRPDVAIFSMIRFRFLSVFLYGLRRSGITLAQICHEFENREALSGPAEWMVTALFPEPYPAFSTIFLLSRAAQSDFCTAYPEETGKTALVPHGPETLFKEDPEDEARLRARYRIGDDDEIVLMVGGLRPSKGVSELIEAFALLRDRPKARLLIAGYPSREFDVEAERARIVRLGIGDRVNMDLRYLGMSELGALVRLARVVAFPYRSATSSGVLALALTQGRPVVATAVGGLVDALEDGRIGKLVPPGDAAALAQALGELLQDRGAAERMGAAGQQVQCAERAWTVIAGQMLKSISTAGGAPR